MVIETPRLRLRELVLDDVAALNEIERQEIITRYMDYSPQTWQQTAAYIKEAIEQQTTAARQTWNLAIVPRSGETLIGRCGLGVSRPQHFEASIWYELRPDAWGSGYAVEAASALLDFAFASLHLHRVWADCDPRNTASCRVAARLGMTVEGTLRENYWLKGEWCSTIVYAILEREWRELRLAQTNHAHSASALGGL